MKPLTSIRFFAALGVVLYHCGSSIAAVLREVAEQSPGALGLPAKVLAPVVGLAVKCGYLGVSFFFVLSGFILTYVYSGTQPLDRRRFWWARWARIYPTYLLGFALSLPFMLLGQLDRHDLAAAVSELVQSALSALALVHAWVVGSVVLWNFPSWSVAVEAVLYLCFPVLLPWLASRRRPLQWGVGLWVAGLALSSLYFLLRPDGLPATKLFNNGVDGNGVWLMTVKMSPLLHLHEFVVGIVAALLFERRSATGRSHSGDLLVGAGFVLLVPVLLVSDGLPYLLLHNGLLAPAFALLIVGLACDGRLARPLRWKGLVLLGEASYALYILHIPVTDIVSLLANLQYGAELGALGGTGLAIISLTGITLALLLSVLVHLRFEEPLRRWLRRWEERRPTSAVGPSYGGSVAQ